MTVLVSVLKWLNLISFPENTLIVFLISKWADISVDFRKELEVVSGCAVIYNSCIDTIVKPSAYRYYQECDAGEGNMEQILFAESSKIR